MDHAGKSVPRARFRVPLIDLGSDCSKASPILCSRRKDSPDVGIMQAFATVRGQDCTARFRTTIVELLKRDCLRSTSRSVLQGKALRTNLRGRQGAKRCGWALAHSRAPLAFGSERIWRTGRLRDAFAPATNCKKYRQLPLTVAN